MRPKEKAEELVSKMNVIHYMKLHGKNKNSKGLPISMYDDQIKQCALIAVDELILDNEYNEKIVSGGLNKIYWQEVKSEIEKL